MVHPGLAIAGLLIAAQPRPYTMPGYYIENTASCTWRDAAGDYYEARSNTVVAFVATLKVPPGRQKPKKPVALGRGEETMKAISFDGIEIYPIKPWNEYQRLLGAVANLRNLRERLAVFVGEQGVGKTLGARHFAENNRQAVYIEALPAAVNTESRLLRQIAAGCGINDAAPSRYDLLLRIEDHVRGTGQVLIIDNADRLRGYRYLDLLRHMHDHAGAAIAFVGTPAIEAPFTEHRELAGRVVLHRELRLATAAEIRPILEGFSDDLAQRIWEITRGRMREVMTLRHNLEGLASENRLKPAQLTPEMADQLAQQFMLRARKGGGS